MKTKSAILNSILLLIRPIIRLALRNGVTFREFTDLCKLGYVEVASDDYGVNGRSTNISRIAMMTGINRKDIKRLKDALPLSPSAFPQTAPDRIARIISGWHYDADFLDHQQKPLTLPLEGDISFVELVRRYGGDIAPVSLLKELKRSGVIAERETGILEILKNNYIPNHSAKPEQCPDLIDPKALMYASSILNDHITTIFHNLYQTHTELPKRFERRATNYRVNKNAVTKFRKYVENLGQTFLEDIDQWLSNHEVDNTESPQQCIRLGTGVYWIEGANTLLESSAA